MAVSFKEQQLFLALRDFCRNHGYAPSIRELHDILGESSRSAIQAWLEGLQAKKFLTADRGQARARRLTTFELPLQGYVQAGYLEHPNDLFAQQAIVPFSAQQYRSGDYALQVSGNSMEGGNIHDGDVVVIRPTSDLWSLTPGTTGVVWIEGIGSTLKNIHYREGDNQVILHAANQNFENPRMVMPVSEVVLQGVLLRVHSDYIITDVEISGNG